MKITRGVVLLLSFLALKLLVNISNQAIQKMQVEPIGENNESQVGEVK